MRRWLLVLILGAGLAASSRVPRVEAQATLPMGVPDLCAGSSDNVPNGVTVNLSGSVTKGCYGIHGTVNLADGTTLTATTILVYEDGTLQTASGATGVTIRFANVAPTDTLQWGTGLVAFGHVSLLGAAKTAFLRSTTAIAQGATSVTLASSPSGWSIGDRLVIPDSHQHAPETADLGRQNEVVTVTSVAGATIGISATTYAHPGAVDVSSVTRYTPHVGNLTRSIVVTSVAPSGTRGHVVFLVGAVVDIENTAFVDLGRTTTADLNTTTNIKGRYPFHFHMMGNATCTATGNVIERSPKWGMAIHQTNNCTVSGNVIYQAQGAGLVTEDGNESGNLMSGNFIAATTGAGGGPNERRFNQDFGFEGTGLWLRGPANFVRNNVVAGADFACLMYDTVYAPVTLNGVEPNHVAIATPDGLDGNELYACRDSGMQIYDLAANCCATIYDAPLSTISDMVMWHVSRYGLYAYGQNHVTLDHWTIIDDASVLENSNEGPLGVWFGDYISRNFVIDTPDWENLRTGLYFPPKVGDLGGLDPFGNLPGTLLLTGGTIRATNALRRDVVSAITGGGVNLPARVVTVTGTTLGGVPGDPGGTAKKLRNNYGPTNGSMNLMQLDRLYIDSDQLFWEQQAGSFIPDALSPPAVGSPQAGRTNTQLQATYGKSMGGELAACATVVSGYDGFKCGGSAPPPPPPPPDTQAPVVDMQAPLNGVTVVQGATVSIAVVAHDNVGIVSGTLKIGAGSTTPQTFPIATSFVASTLGDVTVVSTATDAAGNVGTDSATVTVIASPPPPDTTPPVLTIISPAPSTTAQVGSSIALQATATDNVGVTGGTLQVGGAPTTTVAYPLDQPVTAATVGTLNLILTAHDAAGNTATRSVAVTIVDTPTPPPTDPPAPPPPPPPPPPTAPAGFTLCALEDAHCSFVGDKEVVYGYAPSFTTARTFSNGVDCTNAIFGDPVVGVSKACFYRDIVPPPPPPPVPPPVPPIPPTVPVPSLVNNVRTVRCALTLAATPPVGTGWTLQFREGSANRGNRVTREPYQTTFVVDAGNHALYAYWTKNRVPAQASPVLTVTCP